MYYVSRGRIQPANKQFSTCKNDYEMMFTRETEIEEVEQLSVFPCAGFGVHTFSLCAPLACFISLSLSHFLSLSLSSSFYSQCFDVVQMPSESFDFVGISSLESIAKDSFVGEWACHVVLVLSLIPYCMA